MNGAPRLPVKDYEQTLKEQQCWILADISQSLL